MQPRYPIYVPSKGRHATPYTINALMRDGVRFWVVTEEAEVEQYARIVGRDRVLVLPFSNQGLIASRNWIRDHAEESGAARHWQLDDNITEFRRLWKGKRIPCHAGAALRVCEELTDRFSNVGISGLNYQMFVPSETRTPYYQNVHVYSCTLINHALPYRWRLAYNDDTDICLQALANGWTTLLVNATMANKLQTMKVSGGNTDGGGSDGVRYRDGAAEHSESATDTHARYEMAAVLERAWPGVVKVGRRFGRYQHTVNWGAFRTELEPVVDLDALPESHELGIELRALKAPESPQIRALWETFAEDVAGADAPSREWRGMPAFIPVSEPPKLTVVVPGEAERSALVDRLGVTIAKKTGDAWSAWWPPRGRQDLAALRFEVGLDDDERVWGPFDWLEGVGGGERAEAA